MPFPQLMGCPTDSFKGQILATLGLSSRKNDMKDSFPKEEYFLPWFCQSYTLWTANERLTCESYSQDKGSTCGKEKKEKGILRAVHWHDTATQGWGRGSDIFFVPNGQIQRFGGVKGTCQILACVSDGTENNPCFCGPLVCHRFLFFFSVWTWPMKNTGLISNSRYPWFSHRCAGQAGIFPI